MREVMHDGKTQARAQLGEHAVGSTFGVGALAGLQGEVTIDDGVVLIARGSPENVSTAGPDAAATLLTTARVPSWREFVLDRDADLEQVIAAAVRAADRAEVEPVPFLVVGPARGLALHVVRAGPVPTARCHRAASRHDSRSSRPRPCASSASSRPAGKES